MNITVKIEEYCLENGMTIYRFERHCKLANGTVGKWRKKTSYPSLRIIERIARSTDTSMTYWIGNGL